jgi:hypothetical protein
VAEIAETAVLGHAGGCSSICSGTLPEPRAAARLRCRSFMSRYIILKRRFDMPVNHRKRSISAVKGSASINSDAGYGMTRARK